MLRNAFATIFPPTTTLRLIVLLIALPTLAYAQASEISRRRAVADLLVNRAESISTSPSGEVVVFVAKAPLGDGDDERWLAELAAVTDLVRRRTAFARIESHTIREAVPPPTRGQATTGLRDRVSRITAEGRRPLIVPVLSSPGDIEDGVRKPLDGLEYAIAAQPAQPDPRIAEWLTNVSDDPSLPALEETVVVTATRVETPIQSLPISVTVITRQEVEAQVLASASLADALGKLVPGLAPGSQSRSLFGQTLRGRNALVMIDGVPQSAIRNVSRDLWTIDPSAIERIEVTRGATAIYGDGAAGGVINIITRRPEGGPLRMSSEISTVMSLTHADAPSALVRQDIQSSRGRLSYRVNAALERTTGFFDADGDRLPPDPHGQGGPADTRTWSVLGTMGFQFDEQQLLRASVSRLDATQTTTFASDPAVNRLPGGAAKAQAIDGLQLPDPQHARQTLVNVDYTHRKLAGQRVHAQGYYRDYLTRFFPFDGRAFPIFGRTIYQSYLDTEKAGGRFDVETTLSASRGVKLVWGADLARERTQQPVTLMDPASYEQSGGLVFQPIASRGWVPPMEQRNIGAFGQLEAPLGSRLLVRGGFRAEAIGVPIADFVTLAGTAVTGGRLEYRDVLFNAGATFYASDRVQLFGHAGQGVAVPDIGLILRGAAAGATVSSLPFGPQKVDSYEVGVRSGSAALNWTASVFYNRSDLGSSSGGFNQPVVRAPERVYGVEAAIDGKLGPWQAGGTATWLEGKSDPNLDGIYTYLNSYRIAPPKLTVHLGLEQPRWNARLQVLYSGNRDRFPGSVRFGERAVTNYTTMDALASIRVGTGRIQVGVENLLNRQYFVRESQLLRTGFNDSYTAARGATLSLGYVVGY